METKAFNLKSKKPLIMAGPCSAETEEQTMETCRRIAATGRVDVLRAGIWKPRTRPGMFEGVGLKGLAWLNAIKKETGMPVAVEVATAKHVESALEFGVDILWIGARTTGNPFSVQDIADALRGADVAVLLKNPMNPDLDLWAGAMQRIQKADIEQVGLIHRGFSHFGGSEYRNNPMWHMAIEMKRRLPEVPVICDPSHICGNRIGLAEVSQVAADLDYDGLIVESHVDPDHAWSDAAQQITPERLAEMLSMIKWRASEATGKTEFQQALMQMRGQIDQLDNEVFMLLSKRMRVAEKIGEIKRDNDVTILQSTRWSSVVDRFLSKSDSLGLSREFLSKVLDAIHIESINLQNEVMNKKG